MNKINLLHISIILLLMIILAFFLYQYRSSIPKKINISEDIEIEELPKTDQAMQDINNKMKKVICSIETEKLSSEDYYNYVSGKGVGKKANCSILLKMDGEYYEIKTLLEGNVQVSKVNFVGCVKSKYIKEGYELLLYDKEKQKIYTYIGGTNERKN